MLVDLLQDVADSGPNPGYDMLLDKYRCWRFCTVDELSISEPEAVAPLSPAQKAMAQIRASMTTRI